ncbi:hypothetical protein [Rhodoferax sp.]|nr:hypothetical protein [Rhodoferax sp.]
MAFCIEQAPDPEAMRVAMDRMEKAPMTRLVWNTVPPIPAT